MRVLEYGLAAMAKEVGRTFDRQQWQNIIEEIESAIRDLRKSPQTPEKAARLQFLSEAAKEFFYFKTGGATTSPTITRRTMKIRLGALLSTSRHS